MNRRESLKVMALSAGSILLRAGSTAEALTSEQNSPVPHPAPQFDTQLNAYPIKPVFTWLRLGDVKPSGWLKEQMLQDLRTGSSGHLDKLCSEASGDIFATGRHTPAGKYLSGQMNWWNGETEGNWRAGYIMLAFLSEDRQSMQAADQFVRHVLQFQDEDGYLGIYSKELRYGRDGDLWTQTCLLRGLLAYAELTRNLQVFNAVVRCVDGILHAYDPGKAELKWGEGHDLMIVDVLERLYDITGDPKYRDFGVGCYQTWSEAVKNDSTGHDDDVSLGVLLDKRHAYYLGHCDRTVEHVRVPLWLWMATGEQAYDTATRNAFDRLDQYAFISGSIVSNGKASGFTSAEFIANGPPDPFEGEYEYCTSKEVQIDFESVLQKSGRGTDADRVECVFFNALQGARMQDGSALTYMTAENRLSCDGKGQRSSTPEPRNKFSPTHQDVAVCCNPSAATVLPIYVRGMWMRHRDGGLVALLYGPCTVSTRVNNTDLHLEERTSYPFEHQVEVVVRPSAQIEFSLYFRNPEWSKSTSVLCAGARIEPSGDYWKVTKRWHSGDVIDLHFTPSIRQLTAHNGEVALQFGALLFAQPIEATAKPVKDYPLPNFHDTYYEPVNDTNTHLAFKVSNQATAFNFIPAQEKAPGSPPPSFTRPGIKLQGTMINTVTQKMSSIELVPMGSAPTLRRLTFPVVS